MSGLIPQHFIDDLISRADIVEVLGKPRARASIIASVAVPTVQPSDS
jgi:hypothetical protein